MTLLAGGIGVTPLRALLEELPQGPGDVTLVYRASRVEDLVLKAELDTLAAQRGARVWYAIGPRIPGRRTWLPQSAGHLGEAEALLALVPDVAGHDVYICGAAGLDGRRTRRLPRGRRAPRPDPPGALRMVTRDPSRRIVLAGAGTAAGLALLFAYPTSLNRSSAPAGTPASGTPRPARPRPADPAAPAVRHTGGSAAPADQAAPADPAAPAGQAATVDRAPSRAKRWTPGGARSRSRSPSRAGRSSRPDAVQVPANNSRDVEINDYAVPILNQEAVQAGSAEIDAVSGATVTSDGYIGSLQSALDQAHR